MNMAAKRRPLLLAVGVVLCLLLAADLAYRYATRGDAQANDDASWTITYRLQATLESPLTDPPMAQLQSATWSMQNSPALPSWSVHSFTTGSEFATTVNVRDTAGTVLLHFHPTVDTIDVLDGQWHQITVRAVHAEGQITVSLTVDGHAGADTIVGELGPATEPQLGVGGYQGNPESNVLDVAYAS